MTYFRCTGSVDGELVRDMNTALNDAFGTSGVTYPIKDWAKDTNLLGPIPIRTKTGTSSVSFNDGLARPLKSLKFTLKDRYTVNEEGNLSQVYMPTTHTEEGEAVTSYYGSDFGGYALRGGTIDVLNKQVINPLINLDFDNAIRSMTSRVGDYDVCCIYQIQLNDCYAKGTGDGDLTTAKSNVLNTLSGIDLHTQEPGIAVNASSVNSQIAISILVSELVADVEDLDTEEQRQQALADWITAHDFEFLYSPWKDRTTGDLITVPCFTNLTNETDASTDYNQYKIQDNDANVISTSAEVSYLLDINA